MHGLPLLPMFVFTVLCSRPVHPSTTQVDIKGRSPSSKVSRLIHQSWVDLEVPDKFKEWQESWTRLNPGWKYVMWTDDANRALVEKYYKWLLPTYDSFPKPILKADFSRYLYMHQFGGVYADLDFQALQPMKELFEIFPGTAFVANISSDHDFEHNTPNAWMASVKGHPFWLFAVAEVIRRAETARAQDKWDAEGTTGPRMLRAALQLYGSYSHDSPDDLVTVLPPKVIYPLDWRSVEPPCTWADIEAEKYSASAACARLHANSSFALTYWLHGWSR